MPANSNKTQQQEPPPIKVNHRRSSLKLCTLMQLTSKPLRSPAETTTTGVSYSCVIGAKNMSWSAEPVLGSGTSSISAQASHSPAYLPTRNIQIKLMGKGVQRHMHAGCSRDSYLATQTPSTVGDRRCCCLDEGCVIMEASCGAYPSHVAQHLKRCVRQPAGTRQGMRQEQQGEQQQAKQQSQEVPRFAPSKAQVIPIMNCQ